MAIRIKYPKKLCPECSGLQCSRCYYRGYVYTREPVAEIYLPGKKK